MRLNRLDLIKYGKFDERSIEFPAAGQDFHLIVGPNEAGKSTLRSAIRDLLFGIPPRSPLGFIHQLNALRLGASIGNLSGSLEFHRTKAQKQTLRTPTDEVLPDNALIPFLGTVDRHFFDQMFGLDHTRLIDGGNSILSAENDVGQVLFQSAAGVASLGKIRDALLEEADKLWAPKKAASRAYYIAADQLEKATAALKEATVRTKVWSEANSKLDAKNEALASVRTTLAERSEKRNRYERVRRTAPYLRTLRECEQQLAELGDVVELPADAAAIAATAERELATAEKLLSLHRQEVERATQGLTEIEVDESMLALASEITALDERRLQYAAYGHDIQMREKEIEALWRAIGASCRQLEWPHDSEEALAARLPTLLVRKELGRLARDNSGFTRALHAAEQAERAKQAEIDALQTQLSQLQTGEIKPDLRAALAKVRALGDPDAAIQKQQDALNKARTELETSLQALGPWRKPVPELSAMQLPSEMSLSLLIQERQTRSTEHRAAAKQRDEQGREVERIELQIAQFTAGRHLITQEAVEQARRDRDVCWQAIKAGEAALQDAAAQFESKVQQADKVSDARLDDVEEAAELQSLQQQWERAKLQRAQCIRQVAGLEEEIRQFDERWGRQMSALGLPDMALENFGEWLAKREKALVTAASHEEAERNFSQVSQALAESGNSLLNALRAANQQAADADSLAALCMQAENHIQSIDDAKVRHEMLFTQWKAGQTQAENLTRATEAANGDMHRWTTAWAAALVKAGLPHDSTIAEVEAALELIAQIEEQLGKVRQIRLERIDAMKADQEKFAVDADRIAQTIAPHLAGQPAAAIAMELVHRLAKAREAQAEVQRLKAAQHTANEKANSAQAAIEAAAAAIKPLMERAGAGSLDVLADAIAKSDARRALTSEAIKAKSNLLDQGDGLTRAQIEPEADAIDLARLAPELEQINADYAEAVNLQATLTGERQEALAALSAIGGSDAAAQAEAQRQEALAQMSDAAERYVRVFTAGRLLRWSIDRYREEKQGPMLTRAGAIFSRLTQGAFSKLVVDFEAEPMRLEGLRADSKPVGVSGMSDGTRDQLYLALRLAALELHLEQAPPLPFIADDLFINYDDGRSEAGFEALAALSEKTQVIFLSHHDHLVPAVRKILGENVNIVWL